MKFIAVSLFSTAVAAASSLRQPHKFHSRNPTTVQYGAFTQTATYSIANQLGYFDKAGLNVVFNQIPNSPDGFAAIQNGTYDVLTATIDNDVNFVFNQGADITVLGQLDQAADLVLASVPNVTCISQLKGKSLIVDAATSGFAFILRDILAQNGLNYPADYSLIPVGGTNIRFNYLTAGSMPNGTAVFATILVYPFTGYLRQVDNATRPNVLARASSFGDLNPLSSSAFTVATATIDQNSTRHEPVTRFLAAMLAANQFLADSANSGAAVNAISSQLQVDTTIAQVEYAAATDPNTGEIATQQAGIFNVNTQGLTNVINVRNKFGGLTQDVTVVTAEATTPGPGQMIDYSLRDEALAKMKDFGF